MTKYHVLPADRERAKQLTEDIRRAADNLWELLLDAWQVRAHVALGYKSWGDYISVEFDFSRRHAYRLVNQGAVIKQLRQAVTHVSQPETIAVSFREAEAISTRSDNGDGLASVHPDVLHEVKAQVLSGVPAREAVRVAIVAYRAEPRSVSGLATDSEMPTRTTPDFRGKQLRVRDEQLLREIHQRINVLSPARLVGLNERDRRSVLPLLDDIRQWAESACARVTLDPPVEEQSPRPRLRPEA